MRKKLPLRFSPSRTARNCGRLFSRPTVFFGRSFVNLPAILDYRALRPLGRKTLAAAVTASGKNRTAALGGHARTEAVATLADKLGWLVGTLHLFKHRGVRPFLSFALQQGALLIMANGLGPQMQAP
jgi:hypothetical protein